MRHNRRLSAIKQYAHNLRRRNIYNLTAIEQNHYAQYLLHQPASYEGVSQTSNDQQNRGQEEDEQIEQQNDGEFSVADYITLLSKQDRQVFKRENPQLPALFFMTNKQKIKYFQGINNDFKRQLQTQPPRRSKTKKIIKFKNDFAIKPFNQKRKVVSISESMEFKQPYHDQIHFS